MTNLEVFLILIIWIAYGVFASYQSRTLYITVSDYTGLFVAYIIFSPIVFIIKAIYGAFKSYN